MNDVKDSMQRICVWLSFLLIAAAIPAAAQTKEIVGYYPSWKSKSGTNVMTPARIPYKKLTIIDYAFFYPLANGTITGRDSVGDDLILNGERDRETGGYRSGTTLVDLAHRNGVKVMLSVGGWSDSYNFPAVAGSDGTRAMFAHSCAEQIRKYGFDGIDIDWEFPCLADHKGTPNDKYNFTKLLELTRDSLDVLGKRTGKHYLLTAALPAQEITTKNFEMEKASKVLDMLNVMTYDLNGEWDSLSGHNSPLHARTQPIPSAMSMPRSDCLTGPTTCLHRKSILAFRSMVTRTGIVPHCMPLIRAVIPCTFPVKVASTIVLLHVRISSLGSGMSVQRFPIL